MHGNTRLYTIHSKPSPTDIHSAISSIITTGPFAKFDETISLTLRVTLDPRKPGQNLRSSLSLPNGSGKALTCLVLTNNDAQRAAGLAAGGIEVADKEITEVIDDLKKGDLTALANVDRIMTTPADMRYFGIAGKVLGPRGLMPNPKSGTCADDLGGAVAAALKGSVLVRVDKDGGIDLPVGKVSMGKAAIKGNVKSVLEQINNLKPTEGKGVKTGSAFWMMAAVSRTMHKASYPVDTGTIDPTSARYWRGEVEEEVGEEEGKEEAA